MNLDRYKTINLPQKTSVNPLLFLNHSNLSNVWFKPMSIVRRTVRPQRADGNIPILNDLVAK